MQTSQVSRLWAVNPTLNGYSRLTVDLTAVRAAVEKYAHSLRTAVLDLVVVDLEVVAPLRRDDAIVHVVVDFVVGDDEVVGVIVRVETVLVVVVHLVVRPHTTLPRQENKGGHDITASEACTSS